MIGPYDLSASLEIPGQFEHERYLATIEKVERLVPKEHMAVHIPRDIKNQIKKYSEYGIIALGMDTIALMEGYDDISDSSD